MQAALHHPAAEHRDSQSSPTRPTADGNHNHHDHHDDDREDGQRPAPSTKPEAHQREAAVEGLISLSQLPPRMSSPLPSPSPLLRPLPPRKRKSPPLHTPPQRQRQHHHHRYQQGARPGQHNLPSDTSQFPPAAAVAAARAPAFTPAVRSPPPPPPLPALDRVVAPYLTRIGAPTSPPPRPSSTTTATMVTPLMAPLLPPLKRLRSIATARPGPGLLAPAAIPSTTTSATTIPSSTSGSATTSATTSTSSSTTAPTTTAAPAAIAPASTAATAHEALRTASVAFLDGHRVAPPPPQPSPSPSPPPPSSSLAPPSRGEESAGHLRGSRRRRRRPRDEDYEDSEYDQDYQDDDDDDDDEEEEDDDEDALMINTRAATAPQLPGLAAGFGGGGDEEDDEEAGAEERERRAVERCLDLGVERNVVEALSTAGVSAERIVELILSEDKEQREGIIRGTGLSKNYIMKLQRRALRTSAHLQLPSPLAHSFRSGLVLHVLFDSHDRALFIKKELCRLLNMKGTTFSYWKKKAGVSDIDTSQDFRLMDKCRSIFGGRSTYTLYSAEQMLTILQCMQRSRQKNCFTNVPELTALIASYHPHAHPQQRPHRYPSSTLLPLLPALAGQPHHDSGGLPPTIDDAADDDDHDQLHEQHQQREEEKKEEEQEARATASTAAAACPAAADLFSGRTATPSPPSPASLTTPPAAFPGPALDKGHFTAADPR